MKKQIHCMVDIETLDTDSTAIVTNIGAVAFTFEDKGILSSFYKRLETDDQYARGRTLSPSTIRFWLQQSDAARRELVEQGDSVKKVLKGFSDWCKEVGVGSIWGNGNMFDNVILRSLFKTYGIKYPVTFRDDLDFRTAKILALQKDPNYQLKWPSNPGVEHNALDDARNQVYSLKRLWDEVLCK